MKRNLLALGAVVFTGCFILAAPLAAQMGRRFPSEREIVNDPVTGLPLTFLTSTPAGDSKIYQTHPQWTADGKWLIFRSQRVPGQALAVNEETGAMVQVTESPRPGEPGYSGMLCIAQRSMKLYIMRRAPLPAGQEAPPENTAKTDAAATPGGKSGRGLRPRGPMQVVEIDLARVFADSEAGRMKPASNYERVCGTTPAGMNADGNMGLDANEDFVYFRITGAELAEKLSPGTKIESAFGPRGMGAGPNGLASMNLKTGETKHIVAVPFQVGHVQTNPWVPGEIMFCWETGGKAPQRIWAVNADGSNLRKVFAEGERDWVTHEAIITKDEAAIAIMGHVRPDSPSLGQWGPAGTREGPTGLAIVNLRTNQMRIIGQTPSGSGLWHVHGSADGRWAVGDDFSRSIYLIDRRTGEMAMLTTGHKPSAADHPHPTFSRDGTRIQIQSAMLSEDGRAMNICIVPVPKSWLNRTYSEKLAN